MRRGPVLALLVLLGSGCAYYNGMYNANRLARAAEKAEREGRSFDAQGLWAQAAVRAESVLARHPTSKWADDAELLRGKALSRRGDCASAVAPLGRATRTAGDARVAEEATYLLGECYVALGNPEAAGHAFARLAGSEDPARRRAARFWEGRALRLIGRYDEALATLAGLTDPRAQGERAVALAGIGRTDSALALAEDLLARRDSTAPWDSLLAAIGRHDPESASRLTDRAIARLAAADQRRAVWLLQDGRRLLAVDSARGVARLEEAGRSDQPTFAGLEALLTIRRLAHHGIATLDALPPLRDPLVRLTQLGGPPALVALGMVRVVDRLLALQDSLVAGQPGGDLELFLAAEAARDTLEAPRLAAGLLRRVVDEWPASPYAPKALLALMELEPARRDSLTLVLRASYPESPYLAFVAGDDAPGLRALEDSLRAFALAKLTDVDPARRPVRRPPPGRPVPTRDSDDLP